MTISTFFQGTKSVTISTKSETGEVQDTTDLQPTPEPEPQPKPK